MDENKRIKTILKKLSGLYPDVKPQLDFTNPFELLIATILSAQCTDERVNKVTKNLFTKYKIPEDYVAADTAVLEQDIFSTGFYKQKTKSIKNCSQVLINDFNGQVPKDFNELVKLPGVGRKTASVVAGNAFGVPAIAVDTHVKRLSNLLGFVNTKDPDKIEAELKKIVPEENWINSSHWLIMHGRNICIARRPKCEECLCSDLCPSSQAEKK
ncbi:MAG: endonuclease III [Rhodothermaceae bacterium]